MRISVLAAVFACLTTQTWAASPPKVTDAFDGIFAAFRDHPLVAIGDVHGLAQEQDFYAALIRDPRFAQEVGNVVLETGGAAQQDTVDRYVGGDQIPYSQLRKVWTDVVGWNPTVTYVGLVNVYATIRAVDQALPPENRIKVWLGEPSIDWSKIKTRTDWIPLLRQRDTHAAELIEREILSKGKKALIIYGTGHFAVSPDNDLGALIERQHPQALFVVMPYAGYFEKSCAVQFERNVRNWPMPALISPIRGSSLESRILPRGCNTSTPAPNPTPDQQKQQDAENRNEVALDADALLYLGPRDQLKRGPGMPDMYLDLDFRAEMERRSQIIMGRPISGFTADKSPAVSRPWWPN
jgi:hypothetical protein